MKRKFILCLFTFIVMFGFNMNVNAAQGGSGSGTTLDCKAKVINSINNNEFYIRVSGSTCQVMKKIFRSTGGNPVETDTKRTCPSDIENEIRANWSCPNITYDAKTATFSFSLSSSSNSQNNTKTCTGKTSDGQTITINYDNGVCKATVPVPEVYEGAPKQTTISCSANLTDYITKRQECPNDIKYNNGNFEYYNSTIQLGFDCQDGDIRDIVSIIYKAYNLMKFIVPVILVIMGIIDLGKAVISQKEDEIEKNKKKLLSRLILAVLFFLVLSIFELIANILASADVENANAWLECWKTLKS